MDEGLEGFNTDFKKVTETYSERNTYLMIKR
jgi:hypothetical protein